jgi:hypothetical protein
MVILDIDKPESCYNCPCHCSGRNGLSYCAAREYEVVPDDTTIPEWCPIETVDEAVKDILATKLLEKILSKVSIDDISYDELKGAIHSEDM